MSRTSLRGHSGRARNALRMRLPAWFLALGVSGQVLAHAADRGFVLLLPTGYYLLGGTLAVAASIVLAAALRSGAYRVATRGTWRLTVARSKLRLVCSTVSCVMLLFLLGTGLFGSHDPLANLLPLVVWTLFWVLFTLAHAVFGNLWGLFNPWIATCWLINSLQNRLIPARHKPKAPRLPPDEVFVERVKLPASIGYWPAILGFLMFAWFELVSLSPEDPPLLTAVVAGYFLFHLFAAMIFGQEWFRRGEPFSVFFRFISLLSPFTRQHRGPADTDRKNRVARADTATANKGIEIQDSASISIGLPGRRLLLEPSIGITGACFVLLTLATVSFDGLNKTFWWLHLNGINPLDFQGRSSVSSINGIGLLLAAVVLTTVYFIACRIGWQLALQSQHKFLQNAAESQTNTDSLSREFSPKSSDPNSINPNHINANGFLQFASLLALAIMPISLGYHLSHYLTQLLVNGQYAIAAISDPFDLGWNLLHLHHFHVTTSFLSDHASVERIWKVQVTAVVTGHVFSVALAHLLALRFFDERRIDRTREGIARATARHRAAVISQLPLGAFMVLYTLFGLWLLATPTGA